MPFDRDEYGRWLREAEKTLESARRDRDAEDFNWSCFKSQQAAEFAVKGLLYGLGIHAVGHSIVRLLSGLETKSVNVNEMLPSARALDRHYIPSRYANAHIEGTPSDYYDKAAADEALSNAEKVLSFVKAVGAAKS